jgi:hypothetical protein
VLASSQSQENKNGCAFAFHEIQIQNFAKGEIGDEFQSFVHLASFWDPQSHGGCKREISKVSTN